MKPYQPKIKMINFTQIPNLLIRNPILSYAAFRLICYLMAFGRNSYPSYRRIRRATGLASSTVSLVLKELIQLGIISYLPGNQVRANGYTVLPEECWKIPEDKIVKRHNPKNPFTEIQTTVLPIKSAGDSNSNYQVLLGREPIKTCGLTPTKKTESIKTDEIRTAEDGVATNNRPSNPSNLDDDGQLRPSQHCGNESDSDFDPETGGES